VLDYTVTLNPYDENYPLLGNREQFKYGTQERTTYYNFRSSLQNAMNQQHKLENVINSKPKQESKPAQLFVNGKYEQITTSETIDKKDVKNYSKMILTYARYLKQIAELRGESSQNFKLMLSDGNENSHLAFYQSYTETFGISTTCENYSKGQLLSLAEHEYTHHIDNEDDVHNQNYASILTELVGLVNDSIFTGKFRA
jgi:hypothetical protein